MIIGSCNRKWRSESYDSSPKLSLLERAPDFRVLEEGYEKVVSDQRNSKGRRMFIKIKRPVRVFAYGETWSFVYRVGRFFPEGYDLVDFTCECGIFHRGYYFPELGFIQTSGGFCRHSKIGMRSGEKVATEAPEEYDIFSSLKTQQANVLSANISAQ